MTGDHAQRWNPWRELRAIGDDDPDGVIFGQRDLPSGVAWWVPQERVILMQPGLLQVRRRCALAHELGHRHLGHGGQCHYRDARRQSDRAERAADLWAARRLITLESLARALAWTDNPDEAADELWVTRRLLDVRLEHIHPSEHHEVRRRMQAGGDDHPSMGDLRRGGGNADVADELQQRRRRPA